VRASLSQALMFKANNWAIPNGTSFHEFDGTGNLGMVIEPHRNLFDASGVPWVRVNDTQVMAAGAQLRWEKETIVPGHTLEKVISGTTATVNLSDTQGGYYRRLFAANGSATNMTTLTGGEEGMEIFIRAQNGNTTLVHDTATAHAFNLSASANLTLATGKVYHFIRGATVWVQV
jgi:hypothetical protein